MRLGINISAVRPGSSRITLAGLLSPYLAEYWDAALGYALVSGDVDTWTGQKLGTVLQAPGASQRPDFTAQNAALNNRPSVDCAITDTKYIRHAATDLLPSGIRPYILMVSRKRTASASTAFDFLTAGSAVVRRIATDSTTTFRAVTAGNVSVLDRSPLDTLGHVHEFWTDASTGTHYALDGSAVTNAGETAATASAATQIRLGIGSDESIAWFGVALTTPPSDVRARALAIAQQRWGTP